MREEKTTENLKETPYLHKDNIRRYLTQIPLDSKSRILYDTNLLKDFRKKKEISLKKKALQV